jgi:hypothetical protein
MTKGQIVFWSATALIAAGGGYLIWANYVQKPIDKVKRKGATYFKTDSIEGYRYVDIAGDTYNFFENNRMGYASKDGKIKRKGSFDLKQITWDDSGVKPLKEVFKKK